MKLTELDFDGRAPIDAYGAGGFRIARRFIEGSVLLLPEATRRWRPTALSEIDAESVGPLAAAAATFDVALIGVGPEIALLPAEARAALEAAGVGVEQMSTPSACRTFNVLLSEDRRVAAALIAV